MSKLTQIENRLKEIDPAGFQRLCDAYLHALGYENINPIGLVIGADKVTQGTPDTLFIQSDGKYVFAEYTTQQEKVLGKFKGDLRKCFNSDKTGIPITQISRIIFCHNSRLNTDEQHKIT